MRYEVEVVSPGFLAARPSASSMPLARALLLATAATAAAHTLPAALPHHAVAVGRPSLLRASAVAAEPLTQAASCSWDFLDAVFLITCPPEDGSENERLLRAREMLSEVGLGERTEVREFRRDDEDRIRLGQASDGLDEQRRAPPRLQPQKPSGVDVADRLWSQKEEGIEWLKRVRPQPRWQNADTDSETAVSKIVIDSWGGGVGLGDGTDSRNQSQREAKNTSPHPPSGAAQSAARKTSCPDQAAPRSAYKAASSRSSTARG